MSVEYRLGVEEDDPVTYQVFAEANRELNSRRGLPDTIADDPPARLLAFRKYARDHHADGYWVAYDGVHMVGFGIGVRHPDVWYLAALHVLPDYQGRGIGRRLLALTMQTAEESDAVSAISAAMQPASNAIYIRAGMLPWTPIFDWETAEGAVIPRLQAADARDFEPINDAADIANIDRHVVGTDRSQQLDFWLDQPDLECFVLSKNDAPAGYAFVSDTGTIGPAAVLDEADAGPLLSAAVERLRTNQIGRVAFEIAGFSPQGYDIVLRLSLRITGTALIVVTSRPLWTPGRYFPSPTDALY